MKRELLFEDVESKILGILGVPASERKTTIYKEEEGEEAMDAAEEPAEEMESETPEEEAGDVDIEGMSYDDKMSLVMEIIDSFEDEEEKVKFVEELQAELSDMVEEEDDMEEEEEEEMEDEESDMEEEDEDFA